MSFGTVVGPGHDLEVASHAPCVRPVQDRLELGHRQGRQNTAEAQEQCEEQPEGTDRGPRIEQCRFEVSPVRGKEIVLQRQDEDVESLEPHPHVYEERNDEHPKQVSPDLAEPEQLRNRHVTGHHQPECPGVFAGNAVEELGLLVLSPGVPGDEQLENVGSSVPSQ